MAHPLFIGGSVSSGDVRDKILGGLFWVGAGQVAVQIIQFLGLLFLIRILGPRDFGMMAMCVVVAGLATIFAEMGLPNALIQARSLTAGQWSAAWWACTALGAVMALAAFAAARPLASLFNEPALTPLVRVLAVVFVINGAAVVPDAMLRRALRFREVSLADVARSAAFVAVAVPLAAAGAGVASLVAGELGGAFARWAALNAGARWRPAWKWEFKTLKPLFAFGWKTAGAGLAHAIRQQLDVVIVGRALGAAPLGGYNLINRVVTAPQKRVSWVLLKVSFPGLARLQDDDERLRRGYAHLVAWAALLAFPFLACVAVNAPVLVAVFAGPVWLFVVTPLRIFCISGAVIAITTLTGPVVLAKGRPDMELKLALVSLALLAAALIASARFGLVGVSFGFLIYILVAAAATQYIANRTVGLAAASFGMALLPGTITAGLVAAATFAAGRALGPHATRAMEVGVTAGTAMATFAAATWALKRDDVRAAAAFLRARVAAVAPRRAERLAVRAPERRGI